MRRTNQKGSVLDGGIGVAETSNWSKCGFAPVLGCTDGHRRLTPKPSTRQKVASGAECPSEDENIVSPKPSYKTMVVSGAAAASRRYPKCFTALRERFGRQAFQPVITLGLIGSPSDQNNTVTS